MKKVVFMLSGVAMGIILIVTMAVSMFACSTSRSAVSTQADAIKSGQVAEMLQNRLYKVDFDRAFPMSAPSFPLNYPYYISVIGDRIESYLPYFGRAYNIPYGGGEGLRFSAPISDYTMEAGRRDRHEISFDARTDEDNYTFDLEIYPDGSAYLTVLSSNRQSISFNGEIDFEPEFEAVRIE